MSEPADGERFQRQHSLSWVLPALSAVRKTVLPALLFLVFWQGLALGWLAVLLVIPATLVAVARYLATRYALTDSELVVRDGILSRNERRVRYSRIHNVDEIQGLVHRLLGVVSVRIETASGGEAEALLDLAPAAVDELRRRVFATRGSEDEENAAAPPILQVPTADLARLGLIKNRGFVVVAAIIGFAYQGAPDATSMPWERLGGWIKRFGTDFFAGEQPSVELSAFSWVLGLVLLFAGAYLLLSAFSIALAVVRFAGFTLTRQGDDLTARFGLLSRLRVTVPRRRIQRLQVDESLMHRIWRRISIRLDTAGGRAQADDSPFKDIDSPSGRQWLTPVTTGARLGGLLAETLPALSRLPLTVDPEAVADADADDGPDGEAGAWRALDRRGTQRLFNRVSLLVLFVAFGLVWLNRWALVLPPIALPLAWWICHRSIAARRYWPTADALWWRRGWPGRKLVVVPYDKIQSVELATTPFDRRYGMARVTVDTAGSGLFPAAQITYLAAAEAGKLARRLAREAARREFVWS